MTFVLGRQGGGIVAENFQGTQSGTSTRDYGRPKVGGRSLFLELIALGRGFVLLGGTDDGQPLLTRGQERSKPGELASLLSPTGFLLANQSLPFGEV